MFNKNFDLPIDEFRILRLSDKLTIFKNYLWWAARIHLIVTLGMLAPFFDFWYFTCIDSNEVISTYCLLGCLVSCFYWLIFYFVWHETCRPYFIDIYGPELTKWLCAGIRYPLDD